MSAFWSKLLAPAGGLEGAGPADEGGDEGVPEQASSEGSGGESSHDDSDDEPLAALARKLLV